MENWYDNVRQLLENETESSCYKVIIKCNKRLLQSASGITKYLRYYKVWQKLMTKCVHYYIVRQVLQSMTVTHFYCKVRQSLQSLKVITEWDVTSFKTFRSASLFSIFFFFCKVAFFDLLFELHAFKSRGFVNCFCSLLFWFIWALTKLYLLLIKDKYLPRSLLTFLTYFLLA